jgi:N utilization substance protein B
MSRRRKARELVLQVLYAWEMTGEALEEVHAKLAERYNLDSDSRDFSVGLLGLVEKNRDEIDRIIQERSENWDLGRVAFLDKNILRIAIAELLYIEEIPRKVSIDEAIELAKKYSTENSGKFVNGILDPIAFSKPKKEKA